MTEIKADIYTFTPACNETQMHKNILSGVYKNVTTPQVSGKTVRIMMQLRKSKNNIFGTQFNKVFPATSRRKATSIIAHTTEVLWSHFTITRLQLTVSVDTKNTSAAKSLQRINSDTDKICLYINELRWWTTHDMYQIASLSPRNNIKSL